MLILSHKEVAELLDPHELIPALEKGFKALSAGQLEVPPRNQVGAPKGALLGMYAFMPGKPFSVKLVSIFHESTPSHQAVITLFNSETGSPIALMDGEHITAMRTAAASLLSIKHLARPNSKTVAIIGTGVQAESHLKMIETLGGIEKIWIASRDHSAASALAAHASNAHAADSIHQAVSNADILCLCTSSPEPVIKKEWLKDGVHITSVGYRPPGGELPRDVIESCHLFVESKRAFEPPPAGSAELQGLDTDFGTELGELLLKQKPGRISETEWTIYKSMGHAMEDLVAASLVYEKALTRKMGMTVEL
ncbi:MAG: ornithine cyclodeaminase family protein [Anaerolineales bacterium]|uniref:ornithine cyclodeaminase family protein n=1 Tax=Candidatus Villigracilis vicinus TaxID=3140679 RepID=UPI003136C18D|nr:ornithine cyclodeaminase family protein [Anaerolineales bacterium]